MNTFHVLKGSKAYKPLTLGEMLSECVKQLKNGRYEVEQGAFSYAFYYGMPNDLHHYEKFETGDTSSEDSLVGEQTTVNRWMSQSIKDEATILRIEAHEPLTLALTSESDIAHGYTCWAYDAYYEYIVEGEASDGKRYLVSLEQRYAEVKANENAYAKQITLGAGDAFLLVIASEFKTVKSVSRWIRIDFAPAEGLSSRFDFDAMPALVAMRRETVKSLADRVEAMKPQLSPSALFAAQAVVEDADRRLFRTRTPLQVEAVERSMLDSLDVIAGVERTNTVPIPFDIPKELPEDTDRRVIEPHFTVGDHMVLQRCAQNIIRGFTRDDRVAVIFGGNTYFGSVERGRFSVMLPPMEATEGENLVIVTPTARLTLCNVCVGEVIFLGGQSNMVWMLGMSDETIHGKDIEEATEQGIRVLCMTHHESAYERVDAEGDVRWKPISPNIAKNFSAIGYLYGKRLHRELKVPIGLVHAAISGSNIACWFPRAARESYVATGRPSYSNEKFGNLTPCLGYNAMVAPLGGLRVGSMLWYQGEGNAMDGAHYFAQLSVLIAEYRRHFGNDSMPITVVELPKATEWHVEKWPPLRAAMQRAAREIDNVTMSVSIDLGHTDVHPIDKTLYAKRAAEATLERFYNVSFPPFPRIVATEREDATTVTFTLAGGAGFVLKNEGRGFETSQDGTSYQPAKQVLLDGNQLTVCSEHPIVKVRYGVRHYADESDFTKHLSLYNTDGNPLDQFIQIVD